MNLKLFITFFSNLIKQIEMIMKKNPEIVQTCEKYDNENQKEELIAALKKLSGGGNQNNLDSSDEDTKITNPNTVEGVKC